MLFIAAIANHCALKAAAKFAIYHYQLFREVIPNLPQRCPHESTMRDALVSMGNHVQQITDTVLQFSREIPEEFDGNLIVSMDGKTLR